MNANWDDALFHFAVTLAHDQWPLRNEVMLSEPVTGLYVHGTRGVDGDTLRGVESCETSAQKATRAPVQVASPLSSLGSEPSASLSGCSCGFCAIYGIRHE